MTMWSNIHSALTHTGRVTDCYDAMTQGANESGVYTIHPITTNSSFNVYCDMETDGGGWTVLLKRQDGSVDFQLNWTDYKRGFGNLAGEHWFGLDNMHLLTHQSSQLVLRTVTTPSLCRGTSLPVQLETHSLFRMGRASAHLMPGWVHTVLYSTMDLGGTGIATTAS